MTHDTSLANQMRLGMRRLAAGVCVVSARHGEHNHAMTASSVTSVSDSPASLLACIHESARITRAIGVGERMYVSVLAHDQQSISNRCASPDKNDDMFTDAEWYIDAQRNELYVKGALAVFECEITQVNLYGTHNVVIADIKRVIVDGERAPDPLIYLDGGYHQLPKT